MEPIDSPKADANRRSAVILGSEPRDPRGKAQIPAEQPMPHSKRPSSFVLRSGEVKAIEVHHLVPSRDEVVNELFLAVRASVDFSQGAELGI